MIEPPLRPDPRVPRPTPGSAPARHDVAPELPASVAAALAASVEPGPPAPEAVARVMRAVRARPLGVRGAGAASRARPGAWGGLGGWSVGYGVAAAAAAALVGATAVTAALKARTGKWHSVFTIARAAPRAPVGTTLGRAARFVVLAPGARRVAVVGDFNGWSASATPMQRATDAGAWTATVVLPEGRHVYAYVVDGARWMPDPEAPLAPADGFGRQNSVLVLAPQYAAR